MMVYELMVNGYVWFMNPRGTDFLLGTIRLLFVIDCGFVVCFGIVSTLGSLLR